MRTLVTSLALALSPFSASALTPAEDQLRTFAACAGRLSAQMEWQWMFDGTGSEQTALRRAAMIELVHATMPPDQGRTVLHWRITAKAAHSALLTRATFNDDADDAAWALQMATAQTADCTALLLS